jgi:hypothetical protein
MTAFGPLSAMALPNWSPAAPSLATSFPVWVHMPLMFWYT